MSLEKYFRQELDYLRELGKEIANEKPHLANFLSEKSADPDVERLLEGFAFLSGSLRAKIEDQFPEFTHSLINMLWPNYLRPTPSMTIVEFFPNPKVAKGFDVVNKGTTLLSRPIVSGNSDKKLQCQFQTCRDVWLNPFSLSDASVLNSNEQAIVSLVFSSESPLKFSELDLNKLRFYLGADDYTNQQLYLWFSYYLTGAEIVVNDQKITLPEFNFSPAGFNKEDALLPYPKNAYSGYRILQEYFCFPESFMFFDVNGIAPLPNTLDESNQFILNLYFSEPLSSDVQIRKSTFRLHCTPAINLFKHSCEPLRFDGDKDEYLLKGSYSHPEWYEIFSVDQVSSHVENTNNKARGPRHSSTRHYLPFESFEHQIEYAKGRTELYYKVRAKDALFEKGFDHYISFVRGDEVISLGKTESISINVTCTNREIPTNLKVGDICIGTETNPAIVEFKNITRPSMPLHPLLDGTLAWKLISNSSLNYLSLLEIEALKEIIRTYDLPSWHSRRNANMSQKKLDAIKSIETKPIDRLFKSVSIRGLQSTLYIKQSEFNSEGEMFLFCTVLSQFFSLYASVNSFHKLKVINLDNQASYEWPIQIGQHQLM
ncbi:type VI secretion system baseplate subunit TssF [Avibacterium gallinarum]|uniref:type VI secretion system baseplate subunit TssF n=1 Tax=Avibacterium gallinarum TaxID=755 RepID=UPI003BF88A5E